ncbi:MAG: cytochrome C [bacterium]|nr:cytochrome C [bacterium]
MSAPIPYTLITTGLLAAVIIWRKQLTQPIVFIATSVILTIGFVLAFPDKNFNAIITKPDNVPIIILFASVLFFTWLSLRRAVVNDERIAEGKPTLEGELAKKKVFTWPDLVYTELICIVLFTAALMVWSILIQAPIEEPASQARTPNPSKAPWYFLGLQELLVYFDPWIAGVLLPSFIIVGLCAIPYIDTNPKGNGYYTFNERPFAIVFFLVGFLLLWVSLVIMGTFLRGPNWSFFGPFEYWDPHKLEPMVNVDLSTLFWVKLLGKPRPEGAILREAPGLAFIAGYFLLLPPILGKTLFKKIATDIGPIRYNVMMHMFLWAALIPIKMVLRWTISLKYFVGIPEWFFNI